MRRLAGLLALVLLLTGCTVAPGPAETAQSGPARFYGQKVEWRSCEPAGMSCASILAPIDWAKPDGPTFRLAVIRHVSHSAKRIGSLFVNPGGPGGSGYDFVRDGLDFFTDATLRAHFDIVGWDPRGVGRTAPLKCLSGKQMDQLIYGVPTQPVGSDAWLASRVAPEKAFAAACKKNSGPLLGHVDAESNARDLDLMRALVGDKKLDYLGFSYGTFFGAHYAKLFPKNVGRLVLDGPVDPSIAEPQDFVTQMAGFESAYRAFLANCLAGAGCPFTGTVDDALAQTTALANAVAAEHLQSQDGRTLTLATIGTGISYPLYSRDQWPTLEQAIADLQQGHADSTFELADGYNDRSSDGTYSEGPNVYVAALCLDGEYPDSLAGTAETQAAIQKAAPTIGTLIAYTDWDHVSIDCQNWPYRSVLHAEKIAAKGAAPIMVVGTTNDPATPYSGAQSLAAQLDSGFLVTRRGEGHTAYASGNACIDDTVDAYLTAGTVPKSDPDC